MTVLAAAIIDAVSTDADAVRRALQTLMPGQASAVLGTNDLKVTTSGGMVSIIAAGKGLSVGSQNTTTQGAYGVQNDANVSQTHSAADPTNPRNDLVGIKIEDAFYSGANKDAVQVIVTGTPAPSPVDPTPPANWLPLARVRVNAGASTLGTITDLRSFVFQAFLPGSNGVHWRDAANARDNLQWDDNGLVTMRNALLVPVTVGGTAPTTSYGTVPLKYDDQSPSGSSITIPSSGSIPGTFRKLRITWAAMDNSANTANILGMRFNGDSGANYDYDSHFVSGGTLQNAGLTGQTMARIGATAGSGFPANSVNSGWIEIPFYATIGTRRPYTYQCWRNDSIVSVEWGGGSWRNTANAITSVTILPAAGSFITANFLTEVAP